MLNFPCFQGQVFLNSSSSSISFFFTLNILAEQANNGHHNFVVVIITTTTTANVGEWTLFPLVFNSYMEEVWLKLHSTKLVSEIHWPMFLRYSIFFNCGNHWGFIIFLSAPDQYEMAFLGKEICSAHTNCPWMCFYSVYM